MTEHSEQQLPVTGFGSSGSQLAAAPGGFLGDGISGPPPASTGPMFSASMFLRCKWWIVGTFVLVSAAALPCIWLFLQPMYVARAIVQVAARVPRIVFDTENNGLIPFYVGFLNTQVSRIRGGKVLRRVLDNPEVQKTKWFKEKPQTLATLLGGNAPSNLERLRDALTVLPRRNTELIDVSVKTLHAGDSKVIVDTTVNEYKQLWDDELAEHEGLVFDTLRSERRSLLNEIDGLVDSMGNLSKRLGTSDPDIVRSQVALQLSALATERENLLRTYNLTKWELDLRATGTDKDATETGLDPDAEGESTGHVYQDDPEWRTLNNAIKAKRHALELARQQFGDAHPRILALLSDVAHAKDMLREREAQIADAWGTSLAGANTAADVTGIPLDRLALERVAGRQARELELLDERLGELRQDQESKGELAKQLSKLDQQLQHRRRLYNAVHERLTALEMEEKAPGRISIADYAMTPSTPFRDRRLILSVMALGGALMMGFAVAYLRGMVDARICEAGEVQHAVRAPFLGQLPMVPSHGDLLADMGPMVTESVRIVRTALLERLDQSRSNVILVTSSTGQQGKTTFAVLMSRSLALLGKKTLLVEADLRRPSMATRLSLNPENGLAALLTGRADEASSISRTEIPGLDVLMAGQADMAFNPELLANGVMGACLERWRKTYDFVVLDAPPVLPVADARILAGQADGTVLVMRATHSRRGEVVQAYADLCASGGKLVGTVLMGTQLSANYGYYGSYQTYFDRSHTLEAKV